MAQNFIPTVAEVLLSLSRGHKNKTVAILSKLLAPPAQCVLCAAKARIAFVEEDQQLIKANGLQKQLHTYSYLASDPEIKARLMGSVTRANFTSPLANRISKRGNRLLESGTYFKIVRLLNRPMMSMVEFNQFQHRVYKECLASDYRSNMDKQDEVKPVKMHQVKRAIISCLVSLSTAIYTLAAEAIRRRKKKGQVDPVNIRLTSQLHPDLSKRHSM